MKLIKLSLLILVIVLFAICCDKPSSPTANSGPGVKSPSPTATPDEFAGARANFAENCQKCHGANAEGGTVKLDSGKKLKVPALREGHALNHPDSDFVDQITKGGDGMPAFKDKLKPEDITGLVRFIRHEFQGGRTPPPEPMKPMKHMPKNMPM